MNPFTQINVHQFSRLLINQNILDVSVTQAHDVANCGIEIEKLESNSLAESERESQQVIYDFKCPNLCYYITIICYNEMKYD